MPLTAIASAVAAVSGSAFGARNWDYLSRTHTYGTKFAMLVSIVIGLLLVGIGMPSSFFYQGIGRGTTSLAWTIIRELVFTVGFTYLFGIVLNWGLTGIWVGLAVGRIIASILNFTYARYTIRKLKSVLN